MPPLSPMITVACTLLGIACHSAIADTLPPAEIGKQLYEERCAVCHEDPKSKAPPPTALAQLSAESILRTLEIGAMQPQAAGLDREQKSLIALYLAGDDSAELFAWLEQATCKSTKAGTQSTRIGSWGIEPNNRRYMPGDDMGLDRSNVAQLEQAWSFVFPKVTELRAQPVLTDTSLYIGDNNGMIYNIDRAQGCVQQTYRVPGSIRSALVLAPLKDRTLLVFADSAGTVHALDSSTMQPVWKQQVHLFPTSLITGSITYEGGQLFVPISSYEVAAAGMPTYPCCSSHGGVVALNAVDGSKLWTWHATEKAVAQGKNSAGKEMIGPSGAAVWTTPAVDSKRGLVYIGTGENLSAPATGTSDAIIAIDRDSGKTRWVFQALADDIWNSACLNDGPSCPAEPGPDFDFGASVIIAELPSGDELLLAGQKAGIIFALNPDSGNLEWQHRVSQGTTNGGIHWGMALSGTTLLAPVSDPERNIEGYKPQPGLYAVDITTGKRLWQSPASRGCKFDYQDAPKIGLEQMRSGDKQDWEKQYACSFYYGYSSAALASDDIVFSAGLDGRIRAFDIANGQLLWLFNTAIPVQGVNGIDGHGGAIDVAGQVADDGWLYVLSGYSMFGQLPGNVLMAFKLKEPAATTRR